MKITTRHGFVVLALTIAGPLFAQAAAVAPTDFATLDKNKDGKLSVEETVPRSDLNSTFESLDKNSDGFLTAVEFAAWSGAGKVVLPVGPGTGPSGSGGAQHMPKN